MCRAAWQKKWARPPQFPKVANLVPVRMGIEPTTALLKLSGVEPLGHLDGVTENQH
jgi:hypothetical protein